MGIGQGRDNVKLLLKNDKNLYKEIETQVRERMFSNSNSLPVEKEN